MAVDLVARWKASLGWGQLGLGSDARRCGWPGRRVKHQEGRRHRLRRSSPDRVGRLCNRRYRERRRVNRVKPQLEHGAGTRPGRNAFADTQPCSSASGVTASPVFAKPGVAGFVISDCTGGAIPNAVAQTVPKAATCCFAQATASPAAKHLRCTGKPVGL